MKLPIRSVLIFTLAATLSGQQAFAAETASVRETVHVGSGAIIGASIGGPLGLIIGAAIGGQLADKHAQKIELTLENQKLQSRATESTSQLQSALKVQSSLATQLQLAQQQLQSLNTEFDRVAIDRALIDGLQLDVLFGTNETELGDTDRQRLRILAELLKRIPDAQVHLGGFADARGDASYNDTLSLDRAYAVADALSILGVSNSQIKTFAYGSSRPSVIPGDLESYSRDRRVSIELQIDPQLDTDSTTHAQLSEIQ